ncbi:hypothetical protein PMKS-000550 [Pichia membranifaciens]|uniref:Uncharacterized protein n=1 Tax=Pichia membranifaciens TaxID=4926 RepID=A0A1Q2YC33_9ASCO|nr:hypothetical protein PMKS-000550 [Pichia membranifaciens]
MRHLTLTARSDDLNLDIEMQDGSTESDDASVDGGGASAASSACSSSSSAGGSQTASSSSAGSSSASSVPTASPATATQIMDIPAISCTDGHEHEYEHEHEYQQHQQQPQQQQLHEHSPPTAALPTTPTATTDAVATSCKFALHARDRSARGAEEPAVET